MDNGWVYEYIFDRRGKKDTEGKVWDLWNPGIFGCFGILFGFMGEWLYIEPGIKNRYSECLGYRYIIG